MIAELIKLSKELYELEMVEESINIDNMIHKLYGMSSEASIETFDEESDDIYSSGAYDIIRQQITENSHRESFKEAVASIICDSLDASEVQELRDLLTDYVE